MHGLYAALVGLLIYAAFGSSSHISVGPAAISSLLTATALHPFAQAETSQYIALAGLLAVLTGLVRFALAALQAGTLMNLVSHPVITGFTGGAAVVIIVSQLRDLLGVDVPRSGHVIDAVRDLAGAADRVSVSTAAIGLAGVVVLVASRRVSSRLPAALLVVVAATAAVPLFGLDQHGVAVLGDVPAGLPTPAVPTTGFSLIGRLLPSALVLALIGYLEAISSGKAVAMKTRERIDPNREMAALGVVSFVAGFFRGFPIGGSFSRTALNHEAGARSQVSGLVTAGVLAVAVLFMTPVLHYLPRAILAAVVVVAVAGIIDLRSVVSSVRMSRTDGAAVAVTLLATVLLGVEWGFLVGAGVNLALHLYGDTRPHIAELGRVEGTGATYRNVARYPVKTQPDIAILRMDAPLCFLTSESFTDAVNEISAGRPELRGLVIDASPLTDLDATGAHALQTLLDDAADVLQIRFATVRGPVRDALDRAGLWKGRVEDLCYPDIETAVASLDLVTADLRRSRPEEREPERRIL